MLALDPHAVRHPPDGRMVEEQGLHRGLEQVHQVVAAADVGQLVGQDQLELPRGEAGERAGGQQDHGPQPADHRGHLDESRFVEAHRRRDPQGVDQTGQHALDRGRRGRQPRAPQALHEGPAAQRPQREKEHAGAPEAHQAGRVAGQVQHFGRKVLEFQQCTRLERLDVLQRAGHRDRRRPLPHRAGGVSRAPGRRFQPSHDLEGHHGQQEHEEEGRGREQIADLGRRPPHQEVQARQQGRHGRSLPDEVQQAPAKGADHCLPPSSRSSISRMRASSSRDVFRAESACITSLVAEPPKARSSRSRTSWRCVWSSGAPAA